MKRVIVPSLWKLLAVVFVIVLLLYLAAASPVSGVAEVVPSGLIGLVLDDGSFDSQAGYGTMNQEFLWLNRFSPQLGAFPFRLQEIHFFSGSHGVTVGDDITLVVYENTTGSTDPAPGSNLRLAYPTTIKVVLGWNVYTLEQPVTLNGPGDVLIGVIAREVTGLNYTPAAFDSTTVQQRSWLGRWSTITAPDPPTLPPTDRWTIVPFGNWMIRGYGTGPQRVYLPLVVR